MLFFWANFNFVFSRLNASTSSAKNNLPERSTGAIRKKPVIPKGYAMVNGELMEDRVLWIGSLKPDITEKAIREKFSK